MLIPGDLNSALEFSCAWHPASVQMSLPRERRVWLSAGFPVLRMRVDVLGSVAVRGGGTVIAGQALGGRRARVVLVALALADGSVSADRLARLVWGEAPPSTWPVALRGLVRGLRAVCAPAGGGDQHLIATVPSGYQLAADVRVDVVQAAHDVTRAAELLAEGRYQAVVELAEQIARQSGDHLLPGEDLDWIDPYRYRVDATALRAVLVVAAACSHLADHHRAIETIRRALTAHPLEESLHRALIAALDDSGIEPAPSWPMSSAARCWATNSASIPVPRPSRFTWRRCAARPCLSLLPSLSRQPPLSGARRRAAPWRRRWQVRALSPSPVQGVSEKPV